MLMDVVFGCSVGEGSDIGVIAVRENPDLARFEQARQ